MLYMVIETFRPDAKEAVYTRFQSKGRMLPTGLHYLNSWVEEGGNRCFQLMSTEDASLFPVWIAAWEDLVEFEIVPVSASPNVK